ncbi:hypothetical protein BQ8794_290146 [Mesorhizobium prunaredense]|uniref:Uncharacterized protein n=1 Tax=Mesorhizobium prunaredense TaxID=1631249 RepID=A0A1R3V9G7_9HYPH|nr:hypothetical protein BQ8794_290146 [Mesorhizobium prunaredense]
MNLRPFRSFSCGGLRSAPIRTVLPIMEQNGFFLPGAEKQNLVPYIYSFCRIWSAPV